MKKTLLTLTALTACVLADVRPADACGGCFSPPTERTVVTDHRMALSISTNQTVLWDQIRYSGDPAEFAWVLPVRQGAAIELANDEFFTALDQSSQPTVYGPNTFGGNAGCGLTGCSESSTSAEAAGAPGSVQVLKQSVIGPYETVTLRATDEDALTKWLTTHSFAIPKEIEPTIAAYVSEKFDFIALRLRPQCNERAMRPVRVITPGADPTLPLRMVAAGVGPRVGITLWVIAEGKYEPQNFASEILDDEKLRWNRVQFKSNYEELSQEIMAKANGRTWHLESASNAYLPEGTWSTAYYSANRSSRSATPLLADALFSQCGLGYNGGSSTSPYPSGSSSSTPPLTPCPNQPSVNQDSGSNQDQNQNQDADSGADSGADAGADAGDGGVGDGEDPGDSGAPPKDAGSSGGESDAGTSSTPKSRRDAIAPKDCIQYDDLDVALYGLHRRDVWVTRLRAVLPVDALQSGDLRLQPSKQQTPVTNLHSAIYYSDQDPPASNRDGCGSAPKEHRSYGSWVLAFLSAVFGVAVVRRRKRR